MHCRHWSFKTNLCLMCLCLIICVPALAQTVKFTNPITYPASGEAMRVWVADLNRDGKPDLIADGSHVDVLLGNGDGSFQAAVKVTDTFARAVGDFNNDGRLDLLAIRTDTSTNSLVYLGNADGTFQPPITSPLPVGTIFSKWSPRIFLGDFNHDHLLDVAAGQSVLLGHGDGTFSHVQALPSDAFGTIEAIADFNVDQNPDLAVLSPFDRWTVVFGNGNGTFEPPIMCEACETSGVAYAADFNEDGRVDLAGLGARLSGEFAALLGNGDGTFQPPLTSASPFPSAIVSTSSIAAGDFTGFGHLGVAVEDVRNSGAIGVGTGMGDGTFAQGQAISPGGFWANDVAVADLNGDRAADVVGAMGDFCGLGQDDTGKKCGVAVALNMRGTFVRLTHQPELSILSASVIASVNTVDMPSGMVAFTDRGKTLGIVQLAGGQASLTVQTLGLGTHNLTAYYLGDANFNPNWSPTVTHQVRKKPK
jgi:Bacterial Ig-like domain (group 3)/FG-GAP-like repeat